MSSSIKKIIDTLIGSPLCFILGLFTKTASPSAKPTRILLIKLWAIGDSITMLPLAQSIRKQYPNTQIDVLCRYQNADVMRASKLFDQVILFEPFEILDIIKNIRSYDIVFDGEPFLRLSALLAYYLGTYRIGFDHDLRRRTYHATTTHDRSQHMVKNYLYMADTLGIKISAPKNLCKLTVSQDDRHVAQGLLSQHGISAKDLVIALAPAVGSEGKTRLWNQHNWAGLADALTNTYKARIIFLGTAADTTYINTIRNTMKTPSISLAGDTTLLQGIALLDRAQLVISLDAGIMHLAAAQGRPTIGLFGPNVPSLWAPYGEQCRAIYHPITCSPCIENKTGYIPDCLRTTDRYLCMRLITTVEVLRTADDLYNHYVKRNHHQSPHRREHQNQTRSPRTTRPRHR